MKKRKSTPLPVSIVRPILSNIKKNRESFLLIITFLTVFLVLFGFPEKYERVNLFVTDLFYKIRYRLAGKQPVSPSLYVFTIDDNDIEELKIDRYDRTPFAGLLDILKNGRAKTITFDILFKERALEKGDSLLTASTGAAGNIFYPVILGEPGLLQDRQSDPAKNLLKKHIIFPSTKGEGPPSADRKSIIPFDSLIAASKGIGDISVNPGKDGVVRKISLIQTYREGYIPSLVLRAVCDFFEVNPGDIRITFGKHLIIPGAAYPDGTVKDIYIPIDNRGQMVINHIGPWNDSVEYYSVRGLIKAARQSSSRLQFVLENSFIIVTDISSINNSNFKGVFEAGYPHSGILINAINTILTGNFIKTASPYESILLGLLSLLIICLLAAKLKAKHFIPAVMLFSLLIMVINLMLFLTLMRLPVFFPSTAALFAASGALLIFKLILFIQRDKKLFRVYREKEAEIIKLHTEGIQNRQSMAELYSRYGISKRQQEIIALLKLGKQRKEISWELEISEHTVDTHFKHIFHKCNVSSAIELVRLFKD